MLFHPDVMKGYIPDQVNIFPPPQVQGYYSGANASGFKESPTVTLGKIIAADVVLNNPTRMPLIWNNPGNISNVFIEVEMTPNLINKD